MKLSELLGSITVTERYNQAPDCAEIKSICIDSRKAAINSLFVCISGAVHDSHAFAMFSYNAGSRVFIAERKLELPDDAAVYIVPDTRIALAELSAAFYGYPARSLRVVGITGTKGKTTTAMMIKQVMCDCGIPTGYIGTIGIEYDGKLYETINTTPESLELHKYMRDMVNAGIKYVIIEVSSQALKLNRVNGIVFDTCIFTNISPDHIGGSEHKDFDEYFACKHSLFTSFGAGLIITNADDAMSDAMTKNSSAIENIIKITAKNSPGCAYTASAFQPWRRGSHLGIGFRCSAYGKEFHVSIPFAGEFSMYNAMSVLAFCSSVGIPYAAITASLERMSICGRFELIHTDELPDVTFIIDYAHNGVSLSSLLTSLRMYSPHRIICMFGSVGGRTYARRKELGAAAAELADLSILTSDNPNNEPPENVVNEIAEAFIYRNCRNYVKICDRAEAIAYAVSVARTGDIIVFAGKGHERYQLIHGVYKPFNERDILLAAVRKHAAYRHI